MQQRPHEGYYLMYLRKSRADVEKEKYGQFETLAIHEEQLSKFAQRENYPIAEIYRELVCGESIAERHEFQKIMERINDPECRGVIVHAVDRLGRGDPMEYGWILSSFRFSHTLIITPTRTYDPCIPDDLQSLKLQMFVANVEYDHIRERMHNGSVASAERGNYQGSKPPYGYDRAIIDRRHTLAVNDAEAPTVKRIFQMAADGYNKGAIARALNSDGIPTQNGYLWTAQRIGTMIKNPIYKGYIRYGYTTQRVVSRDGLIFNKKTTVNKDGDYVLSKGVHEPIVSEELWELANKKAFDGVPVKRNNKIQNPLAGLIVCGKCGRALIRQDVKGKNGGHFPRLHHAYYTECQCKSISIAYVMDCLCDALEEIAADLETGIMQCGVDPQELAAIEKQLSLEENRLDKLIELYNVEAITVQEFKSRRSKSDELVKRLRQRHDELMAKDVTSEEIVFSTREALEKLRDDSVSAEDKNSALKSFIERIDYFEIDTARKNRKIELHVKLRGV